VLCLCPAHQVVAQSPACSVEGYRIITPQLLAIQCKEGDISTLRLTTGTIAVTGGSKGGVPTVGKPRLTNHDLQWILVPLRTPLEANKTYSVTLAGVTFRDPVTGKALESAGDAGTGGQNKDTYYSFNTKETATVVPSIIDSQRRRYEVKSNLAFLGGSAGEDRGVACKLLYKDASGRRGAVSQPAGVSPANKALPAGCTYLNYVDQKLIDGVKAQMASGDTLDDRILDTITTGNGLLEVGHVTVVLDNSLQGNFAPLELPAGLDGLLDIFGNKLSVDPKSKFKSQKAPATKDASQLYLNMNYAGGVGSKPAWVADFKAAPQLGPLEKGFQISPLVTTDIGHNTISGITYTDTIDLGVSAARVFMPRSGVLQEILFTPGVTYETDREFDRDNLLATTDFRFNFAHLYSPQSTRSLQQFAKDLKNNPSLTPDQEPVPFWGYQLDFHLGTETGGSLTDTTVKATTGGRTQTLPAYSVARIVPQVHGLLQLGPVSFDCTGTERYLATTENTVVQLQNNHLLLEHVTGWKGYGALIATFKPDQTGHFALTLTYKNGFAPPKYQRVNTVQAGVLLIY
jgi:hypothetical protein